MTALDASALLAFLFREPGYERVSLALPGCLMSTVNLAEVLGRFERDGHEGSFLYRELRAGGITFVPFDADQAARAAALVPFTHHLGLSLGDRACLALAMAQGVPALTADRIWKSIDPLVLGVSIEVIRQAGSRIITTPTVHHVCPLERATRAERRTSITINVSEPVYRDFQEHARRLDRTAAELIREAMEAYSSRHIRTGQSLRTLVPMDLGAVLKPLTSEDDLLGEMLDDAGR